MDYVILVYNEEKKATRVQKTCKFATKHEGWNGVQGGWGRARSGQEVAKLLISLELMNLDQMVHVQCKYGAISIFIAIVNLDEMWYKYASISTFIQSLSFSSPPIPSHNFPSPSLISFLYLFPSHYRLSLSLYRLGRSTCGCFVGWSGVVVGGQDFKIAVSGARCWGSGCRSLDTRVGVRNGVDWVAVVLGLGDALRG